MNVTHDAIDVPLYELIADTKLVRQAPASKDAHDQLVASIRAYGLLEPLLVVRSKGTSYRVIAGNRRLAALNALHKAGEIKGEHPIRCTLAPEGVAATEMALAENIVRVAMHPADQVEAFTYLAKRGSTPDEIAVRFGVSKATVERRMRLGALIPPILEAFRADKITDDVAVAFATTPDPERQKSAWKAMSEADHNWSAITVRNHLLESSATTNSPLGIYVGEKAYVAAGGEIEQTLFDDYAVMRNVPLLERLATEKLERACKRVRGWDWVEARLHHQAAWEVRSECILTEPDNPAELTNAEQGAIAALEKFEQAHDPESPDDWTDEMFQEYDGLQQAASRAYRDAHERREYTDEQKSRSGVVLYVQHDGKLGRIKGLVKKSLGEVASEAAGETGGAPAKSKREGYSDSLQQTVAELRSAVIRDALLEQHELAADFLTFCLVMEFAKRPGQTFHAFQPLALTRDMTNRFDVPGASDATKEFLVNGHFDDVIDPSLSVEDLFQRYRDLGAPMKAAITSQVVAHLLHSQHLDSQDGRHNLPNMLARLMDVKFAPTLLEIDSAIWNVDTFWGRLRKDQIIAECESYLGPEWAAEARQMKKGAVSKDAAERMRNFPNWLPRGFLPPETETDKEASE